MVTHDLGVAALTDRKVSMRDGGIVADERAASVVR
jgi:ABC-type lipoprotein export system ATPase subunit